MRNLFRTATLTLTLLAGLVTSVAQAVPTTKLVLVGGGNRPAGAMREFADWAGGPSARVLIIGWSSEEPEVYFGTISADLRAQGVTDFVPSLHRPAVGEETAFTKDFLEKLRGASGVFFAGGDQKNHMKVIALPGIREALEAKFAGGTVFAGTSAGTAIMSKWMLTGEDAQVARGLGLLPEGILVDQHGRRAGRVERDLKAMRWNGIGRGILIDENNAITVVNGRTFIMHGPDWVNFYRLDFDGTIETRVFHDLEKGPMAAFAAEQCPTLLRAN